MGFRRTEDAVLVTTLQVTHQRLLIEETFVAEATGLHDGTSTTILCEDPRGSPAPGL